MTILAQSDTSRVAVRYIDELFDVAGAPLGGDAAWGVIPAHALTDMRLTGESLKHDKKTVRSAEIRADRQQASLKQVGISASGDINIAMSFDPQFIPLIGGALMGNNPDTWASPVTVTGAADITFAAGGKTITSGGAPDFDLKFKVGQYLQIKATISNGTNDAPKFVKVTDVAPTVITCAGDTLADEAGTSAAITGCMMRNGVTERCFTLEKEATDIAGGAFISYSGMEVDQWDLNAVAEQILTGKLTFMGKKGVSANASVGTGASIPASVLENMNATDDVGRVEHNGIVLTTGLKSLSMQLKNNLRARPAIGVLGSIGVGKGRCAISGNVEAYFSSLALYQEFEAHSLTSLHYRVSDENGNAWFFTFPAVRFATDAADAPAADQDFLEKITWEAEIDQATNCQIQVDRFAA